MERVYSKSKTFREAEEWDILQHIYLSEEERQQVARELKRRVYDDKTSDVRGNRMKNLEGSHFSPDVQEFLLRLAEHKVRYVIVGGEAVIYYGYARLTGDVDFFYEASPKNVQRLYDALLEFWDHNIPGITKSEELLEPGMIVQFGVVPNRIDLLNRMDSLSFEEVWANRNTIMMKIHHREIPVYFIGLDQLIKNKEAVARYKDLEDLKYLKKAREQRK